jgi:hypothetical protein
MFSIFYYSCTTRMFLITLVGKRGLQLQRRRSFGGRTRRLEIFADPKSWNQPLACSSFGVLCLGTGQFRSRNFLLKYLASSGRGRGDTLTLA